MPFYYLKSQGFWEALTVEMRLATSPDTCAVCELNPEFHELLFDASFRLKARMILITKYFERIEQVGLFESLGLQAGPKPNSLGDRLLKEATAAALYKGRSARFAVRVVAEYRYTCALTGYRCITDDGAAIVDAAHIEEWAKTRNDDLKNGLALSKSAHWMFDEGLWSVDKNLCVIVNQKRFTENGAEALRLTSYAGRHLQFDPVTKLRPAQEHFYHHRRHHGYSV
jgi:putative restriction endonuclease